MLNFQEHIKKMQPYKPPLEGRGAKDYLLLDFNERVSEPSDKVKQALKNFIDSGRLQIYPEYGGFEEKIAGYAGVGRAQVMASNGGDQGIDVICRAHLAKGDRAIIPCPSFAMHYQSAQAQGAEILEPPYDNKGNFPFKEILDLISNQDKIKLIILCNPNNPLGAAIAIKDVEEVIKKAAEKGIAVLHDEAYFEFSGITAKGLLNTYDNFYIIRTFSKAFGLVSARAGYVISQEQNLQELMKIRGPYDVNMFAKTAVLAALEDTRYVQDYVREVTEESKPRLEEFLKEKGLDFFPSAANFIFLKVPDAEQLIGGLKRKGILVRPKKGLNNELGARVSIGTLEYTDKFIKAFDEIIPNKAN